MDPLRHKPHLANKSSLNLQSHLAMPPLSATNKFSKVAIFCPTGFLISKPLLSQQSQLIVGIIIFLFVLFSKINTFLCELLETIDYSQKQVYLPSYRGPRLAFDLHIHHVCLLQQSFWLNIRWVPLKSYYWNVRKLLENNCSRLKLLSYTRSAILPKMNSFACTFYGLCYSVYVFICL